MTRYTHHGLRLLAALLLAVALPAMAVQYKWVEDNGTITYSQTPPEDGRPYEIIKTTKATSTPAKDKNETDWHKRNEAFKQRMEEQKKKQAQSEEEKRIAEHNAKVCAQMKKNLEILKTHAQVRKVVDGKRVMMTEEERQADIKELEKAIAEGCNNT